MTTEDELSRYPFFRPGRRFSQVPPPRLSLAEQEFERNHSRRVLPPLLGLLMLFVALLFGAFLFQIELGMALWPLLALCCLVMGGLVLWALHERS